VRQVRTMWRRARAVGGFLRARPRLLLGAASIIAVLATLVTVNGGRLPLYALNSAFGGAAHADSISAPVRIPYSHSWYIDQPDAIADLGARDARWLNEQSATSACPAEYLTVLDFGHPTRKNVGGASPLDDYVMSLFGKQDSWRTYREVEQLAERYIDAWVGAASACSRLRLVMGTSNYAECRKALGPCDVYTAGKYWDVVAHDVTAYVSAKGYGAQVMDVWVGDDAETSWDPWPMTESFLMGVRDQERTYAAHARMVNYGDANIGACSEVTGECSAGWTPANVYDAAWGIGWAAPLPEAYTATTTQRWQDVSDVMSSGPSPREPMAFIGFMTECGEPDPLPLNGCRPQSSGLDGAGACELSPAVAYQRLRAADARHPLTYATNIQWLQSDAGQEPARASCH
jgi:hypothetical protein